MKTIMENPQLAALLMALVPVAVALIKTVIPKIPSRYIPVVAILFGVLGEWVSTAFTGAASNPLIGALIGSAGIGLRELADQLKKKTLPCDTHTDSTNGLMPLLVVGLAIGLLLGGCATAQQNAYKSLATVGYSVDAGMKAAADVRVAGKMDQTQWERIAGIHERYRVAYRAAVFAAKLDYSAPAPSEILALAQAVLDAVTPYMQPKGVN